jgi:subtilisin family serine protease
MFNAAAARNALLRRSLSRRHGISPCLFALLPDKLLQLSIKSGVALVEANPGNKSQHQGDDAEEPGHLGRAHTPRFSGEQRCFPICPLGWPQRALPFFVRIGYAGVPMQLWCRHCGIGVFLLFFAFAAVAAAEPAFHPTRVLVIPKRGQENGLANLHRHHRAQLHSRFPALGDIQVWELPDGADVRATVAEYRQSGLVEVAEPDYVRRALFLPNDPYVTNGYQWHLHNTGQYSGRADADIDAPEAWDIANAAATIVVAVVDTGVRYTHEDLIDNMWTNAGEIPGNSIDDDHNGVVDDIHGFSAFGDDGNDPNGHGTHVAGIIGGVGNNGIGISGVAWRVQIMICKFLNAAGRGYDSDAVRCLNYARTNGAHILNCSWGSEEFSSALAAALSSLRSAGIIVAAAAGNEGPYVISFPAALGLDNIVSVGATTRSDERASFSGTGRIYAPGTEIWSTLSYSDASYGAKSGTSMAAPCVAGSLAVVRSAFPEEPYTNIIERLVASAEYSPVAGIIANRLNLADALGLVVKARFGASRYSGPVPLAVDFTDSSFGVVSHRVWNFGDGTWLTNVMHPSHTFSSTGLFQIVLTVTATNGITSSSTQSIRALHDFPYAISYPAYDWITNGMETIVLTNGIRAAAQALPFPFEFYGKPYSQIHLYAYGLAGLEMPGLADFFSGRDLPNTFIPNAIIAPYWMWLRATNAGAIRAGQYGLAPHRKAVFSWNDVHEVNTPTNRFTFQIILHESGHITMQYNEVENASAFYARGKIASIGIEDDTGLVATKYSYRGIPNLVSNGQAIVYAPPEEVRTPARLQGTLGGLPGQFHLRAYTAPGQTCILESSTDLLAWTALRTNIAPGSGVFQVTLMDAVSHCFYRLVLP